MPSTKVLKWGLVLVIASGSLCVGANGTSALTSVSSDASASDTSDTQERIQQASKDKENAFLEDQSITPLKSLSLHSDFHEDFPFSQSDQSLQHHAPATRKKRGSGVVIRGPFYPYPRRGHPLVFASAGQGLTSLCPMLLFVVTFIQALQQITSTWRYWW